MRKVVGSARRSISAVAAAAVLAAVVGVVGTVVPATPAHAAAVGCTPEFAVEHVAAGIPEFSFRRCGVPDFDQIRDVLPNTGSNHCVPTAAADWLVYLADRGARSVHPGPGVADDYARIDQLITDVAAEMGTTGDGGTNSRLAVEALRRWFDQSFGGSGSDYFTVRVDGGWEQTIDGETRIDRPTSSSLAAAAASGSLVIPWIYWARQTGPGRVEVVGGHATALASAHPDRAPGAQPGDYIFGFSDPGTGDGVATTQGGWEVALHGTRRAQIQTGANRIENVDRFSGPGYSMGFLEGSIQITPTFGLFPDPDQTLDTRMALRRAVQLDEAPRDLTIDTLDGSVVDIALGADGASTTALLDDGRIRTIDHVTGTATTASTIPNSTNLVLDDHGRTALIDSDGRITVLDRHHNPVTSIEVPGATGLGYSQRLRAFVTFDGSSQELVVIEAIPGNPVRERRLSLKPEGPPITPAATLAVHPSTGVIGLLEPGTNHLTRMIVTEGRFTTVDEMTLGDGAPLDGLVPNADGGWYSTRDGRVVAFGVDGTERTGNPFAGQPSSPNFEIFQPMNIGTPPEGPHLLPEDAPQTGDQLDLSQASPVETVGNAHDVTVAVTDETGAALGGRTVAFATSGASSVTGTVTTDDTGRATLSWTSATPGENRLTAWEDLDGDAARGPDEPAAHLDMTWTEQAALVTELALASSSNPSRPGRRVTFTATVSAAGSTAPAQGTVQFTSDGDPLGPPVPLDATGAASHTTRSLPAGMHRIEATFTPADGSGLLGSSAHLDHFVGTYTWTGNLIRNPGADKRPGSGTGGVVPVPEWTAVSGGFTAVAYGAVDPRTGLPFPTAAQGPPNGGRNFFAGGPDNQQSFAHQTVTLPDNVLNAVDDGHARYDFRGWLGGYEEQNDFCEPVLVWATNPDGTGELLGDAFLVGGGAVDRNNETMLLPYSTNGQVPAGARSAVIVLEFTRTHGVYNDGYCDSLALKIATPR